VKPGCSGEAIKAYNAAKRPSRCQGVSTDPSFTTKRVKASMEKLFGMEVASILRKQGFMVILASPADKRRFEKIAKPLYVPGTLPQCI
jgi:hypothetical protein